MSQYDFGTIDATTKNGIALAADLNAWRTALHSTHKGAARPSYVTAGMTWINDSGSPWLWYIYDGSADILLGSIDSSSHFFRPNIATTEPESTIASAGTTDLGSVNTQRVAISGTTTITSLGSKANAIKFVRFTGAMILTHGSALQLPGSANILTTSGDTALFISDASGNWKCYNYTRVSGHPLTTGASTIASASTTDLGSVLSQYISVTGTTTINGFGSSAPTGAVKFVNFTGALTLTYNATSMILPSAANISVAAGDSLVAIALGSGNWRVLSYQKANGNALAGGTGILDYQVFTSSGTWTKPAGLTGDELVFGYLWAGGGQGGTATSSTWGGGGGGGCLPFMCKASDLGSTESVTIGAGGSGGGGIAGGNTVFHGMTAYGGTGGSNNVSGNSGGAGGGAGMNGAVSALGLYGGGAGGGVGGDSFYGGGGGGQASGRGGNSIFGGGGGSNSGTAGTSVFGGNGGASGVAGSAPGGGGGVGAANGARGEARIWVVRKTAA